MKDMTEARALARIMELDTLPEAERRVEIRKVLYHLWSAGWSEGYRESVSDNY